MKLSKKYINDLWFLIWTDIFSICLVLTFLREVYNETNIV